MTTREQLIEAVARAICEEDGYEPEFLESGDAFGIDGHIRGEPCHYIWRQWTERAVAALTAIEAAGLCIVPREATEADGVVYMRDFDGTGSMHPCSKGDPGAIPYLRQGPI